MKKGLVFGYKSIQRLLLSLMALYALVKYTGSSAQELKLLHGLLLIPLFFAVGRLPDDRKAKVISILFAVFMTIGFSFREFEAFLDQSSMVYIILAVYGTGIYVLLRILIDLLTRIWKVYRQRFSGISLDRRKAMLLLGVCWLPYYLVMFPGALWYDTGAELEQFFGVVPFNNMNPFLQTILIGSFTAFGKMIGSVSVGIALYTGLQALFALWVITEGLFTVTELLDLNNKHILYCLLAYAVIPIYPLYAFAVGKDFNWSVSILLCLICTAKILHDPDAFFGKKRNTVVFVLALVLVSLLRNSGLPIAVLAVLISFLALRYPHSYKKTHISAAVSFIVLMLFWHQIFLPFMHVSKEGNAKENYSVPLLQLASAVNDYPEDFSAEDETVIGRVVDIDAVKNLYDPNLSDSIKNTYNNDASEEDINAFTGLYRREFARRPLCYIDALIAKSYAYFDPDADGTEKPYAVGGNYASARTEGLGLEIRYLSERLPYIISGLIVRLRSVPLVGLITRCGIWVWIYLAAFIYQVKRLSWKQLLLFVPGLAVLIGLLFTPVNGYFRYVLPIVMLVPLSVLSCLKKTGN